MNRLLISRNDIGQVREHNEDHCWCGKNDKNNYMLIVCDGLGSYKGSKVASEIITRNFVKSFLNQDYDKIKLRKWFNNIIDKSKNDFLNEVYKDKDYSKMSTTIVVSLIIDEIAHIFWMGDSRAYIINKNISKLLTRDHNLKNHLEDSNASSVIFQKYEENLTSITNFIDIKTKLDAFSYKKVEIQKGEILFLCSDGLYNFINIELLYKYFIGDNIEKNSSDIIDIALRNGSDDNISFSAYVNFIKK